MATKKKNWVLIVLGIVILVVILAVAGIVGFGYFMYRQMNISTTTTGNPEQEFADLRARFEGQVPYVELSPGEEEKAVVHRELEKPTRTPLKHVRMVIYDEREHRLVRMTLPLWLLRLGGNHPINLNPHGAGPDPGFRLTITCEDLERRGPGLIVDVTGRRGEHVIAWAE